jgi:hypothetical protein
MMAQKIGWLGGLIIILIVIGLALYAYVNTPQGRVATFMIYGSSLVDPDDPNVRGVVYQMGWGPGASEAIRAWVFRNIRYAGDNDTAVGVSVAGAEVKFVIFPGEDFKSPSRTLTDREGDCEDMAILLASLAMAAGDNARVVLGAYNTGENWSGHAWAEVQEDNSWRIVDPTSPFYNVDISRYRPLAWFASGSWGWYG